MKKSSDGASVVFPSRRTIVVVDPAKRSTVYDLRSYSLLRQRYTFPRQGSTAGSRDPSARDLPLRFCT
ncbi:unnamed protein product [Xylocopa violacea]|uniref:Uncharacterized protein n=1 Tax=Xylocopa violacea TaxID=135666 RepID=A0ABP1N8A5_XYLVO